MINWLNCNQGFVMAVLTAVYVGATILICIFNNKSAKAASEQLKEMQRSQEQNVNIQLFDKRHELYHILNTWYQVSKMVFSRNMINPSTGDILPPKKVFMQILFGETEFKTQEATASIINHNPTYYERTDDYLGMLNDKLRHITTIEPKDPEQVQTIEQAKHFFNNQIYRISDMLTRTRNERLKLETSKHLYSGIAFDKMISFADAFSNAASIVSDPNILKLEEAQKAFEETKILEKMEELLKLQ